MQTLKIISKHSCHHGRRFIVCRLFCHGKQIHHHGRISACSIFNTNHAKRHAETDNISQNTPQGILDRPPPFSTKEERAIPHCHDKRHLYHIRHSHCHIHTQTHTSCHIIPAVFTYNPLVQQHHSRRHQQISKIVVQNRGRTPTQTQRNHFTDKYRQRRYTFAEHSVDNHGCSRLHQSCIKIHPHQRSAKRQTHHQPAYHIRQKCRHNPCAIHRRKILKIRQAVSCIRDIDPLSDLQ